jgi:hypothetical protein
VQAFRPDGGTRASRAEALHDGGIRTQGCLRHAPFDFAQGRQAWDAPHDSRIRTDDSTLGARCGRMCAPARASEWYPWARRYTNDLMVIRRSRDATCVPTLGGPDDPTIRAC